jgi:hypothetical protein
MLMTLNRTAPRKQVEWSSLSVLRWKSDHHGKTIMTGLVEDAMPDSSALWLLADAVYPRQIFEAARGHHVWVTPQQLSGDMNNRVTAAQIFGNSSGGQLRNGSVMHQATDC